MHIFQKALKIIGIIFVAWVILLFVSLIIVGWNWVGPFKHLAVDKIVNRYDPETRSGEIVFYGASNFARWENMEEDVPMYKVQNHGFGGSNDQDLIDCAPELLYPYNPRIIVFQTGSNDYVAAEGTDEEKIQFCMERKKKMFALFHEQLPNAQMIVMSGLYLPGRSEYLDMTIEINRQLKQLCDETDYLTFVDAGALTYDGEAFDSSMFVSDGIHLTEDAFRIWADSYIIPALDEVMGKVGSME